MELIKGTSVEDCFKKLEESLKKSGKVIGEIYPISEEEDFYFLVTFK